MNSFFVGIFDEIVGFHSDYFEKKTKFVWTRSLVRLSRLNFSLWIWLIP